MTIPRFVCAASVAVLVLGFLAPVAVSADLCGDPDGSGDVTVSDGVNVLRAAAGLSSTCTDRFGACDVDDNATITITDGVNVLRKAAVLPSLCDATPTPARTPVATQGADRACGDDCQAAVGACGEELFSETYDSVDDCREQCVADLEDFAVDAPDGNACVDASVRYIQCCTQRRQCGEIPDGCDGEFEGASSACGGSFAGCPMTFF